MKPYPLKIDRIDKTYNEFYDYVSRSQDIARRLESFNDFRSYHYKDLYYIKHLISNVPPVLRVLDIGCCGTPYPKIFDTTKVEYIGIDVSTYSIERMREVYPDKKLKWIVDDICLLNKFADASLDLILATQVFEHLPNPSQALFTCTRKLAPGGRLMIGTEASLFLQTGNTKHFFKNAFLGLFMYIGGLYNIYGCEPMFFPHHEEHTFQDPNGIDHKVLVPHGYFHPLFFDVLIEKYSLPLYIEFRRYTGGTLYDSIFQKFGAKTFFIWQEIKSRIPFLRYFGSQLFISIKKPY